MSGTVIVSVNSKDLLETLQDSWRTAITQLWRMTRPSWPNWGDAHSPQELRATLDELAALSLTPTYTVGVHALTAVTLLDPGPLADFEADKADATAWKLFFLLVAAISENRPAYRAYCARLIASYVGDKTRDHNWWLERAEMYAAFNLPHFARLY